MKKLESKPVKQMPLDTKNMTKFQMMQLGISGEELSEDVLKEIPF